MLVVRQPVLDGGDEVVGYRLEYAACDASGALTTDPAETLELIGEALAAITPAEYARGIRAYLSVSRDMFLHLAGVPRVDPDRVVIRVRYVDALDPSVVEAISTARQDGYQFELDELTRRDFDPMLLRHFETVEFHFGMLGMQQAARLMPGLRLRGATGLAAGVETVDQRDEARGLGCRWFAGPYYQRPNPAAGRLVPAGDMQTLLKLSRLRGNAEDLAELIELIQRDVALGVRLLRYINSAYFGLMAPVRSVRHAAMMLGATGLARWALVAACIGSHARIPRELALQALTRARTCELLAGQRARSSDADVLFTIGLLSAADVIFGMPLEQLAGELALAPATAEALLEHSGPAGEILNAVLLYEQGRFASIAPEHSLLAHADAYRAALIWATEAAAGTG